MLLYKLPSWKRLQRLVTGWLLDMVTLIDASRCGFDKFIANLSGRIKHLLIDHSSPETDAMIISATSEEITRSLCATISKRTGTNASPESV